MNRRHLLLGAGAALIPLPGRAASARTDYKLTREGADIGRHTIDAAMDGSELVIEIALEIAVKILGVTAYRYTLTNTERWRAQRLVSVRSVVDDDGTADRCTVVAKGDMLEIDGSGYSGMAPGDAVTTSYFARGMIDRPTWISSQSGQVMTMAKSALGGSPEGWAMSGQLGDQPFATTLYYDAAGDWVGSFFDARGSRITYERVSGGGINALWAA